ncbi:putative transmembrane protein 244 isoform X7 [Pogona vitticeps]
MVLQGSQAAAIKAITLHILLCLLVFYTVYYMIWSICCGIFRLKTFGLLTPFEFKTEPSFSSPDYLAKVLATSLTFFTSGLLFAVLLRRWVWDYAITVTLTHVLLTFAVMKEFPFIWQWWLALDSVKPHNLGLQNSPGKHSDQRGLNSPGASCA